MLRKVLFMLLFAASMSALADLQASNGADFVVLHQTPCTNPAVTSLVPVDKVSLLHGAEATVAGQKYQPCWYQASPDLIGLLYEDGDTGLIPVSEFSEKGV